MNQLIIVFAVLAGLIMIKRLHSKPVTHQNQSVILAPVPALVAKISPSGKLQAAKFTDTMGRAHTIPGDTPMLVAFWGSNCGYSDRAMDVLRKFERNFSPEQLKVVGFHANRIDEKELAGLQRQQGYTVIVAGAQQSQDLAKAILPGFGVRGTGADLYVVDKDGSFYTIEARSASQAEIESKTQVVLAQLTAQQ